MRARHKIFAGLGAGLAALAGLVVGLDAVDRAFPPPLERAAVVSTEVLDADGVLLRALATKEGRWRLRTTIGDVDRLFLAMLVAYADMRSFEHARVVPLQVARAFLQLVVTGQVVPGSSNLNMRSEEGGVGEDGWITG